MVLGSITSSLIIKLFCDDLVDTRNIFIYSARVSATSISGHHLVADSNDDTFHSSNEDNSSDYDVDYNAVKDDLSDFICFDGTTVKSIESVSLDFLSKIRRIELEDARGWWKSKPFCYAKRMLLTY